MKKYAIIINDETKQCDVGLGTDTDFYTSIGMVETDVEQSYDGNWFLAGFAPEKPDPTRSEISAEREAYRVQNCDPLTCRKIRLTALGKWTDEEENDYINAMNDIEALIDKLYPYADEKID